MERAILALALTSAALAGCRSRVQFHPAVVTPAPGPVAPPGWAGVQPSGAGFACLMPAMPRIENDVGHDDDGARYYTVRARASSPYGTFAMIATHWEGGVVGDLLSISRHLAETILELAETPDHRARRVMVPGFYAREDTGHTADGTFFALRQFFGRERIYVAVAAVRPDPMGLRAAEQFMESIALDRRDSLLPSGESTIPVPIYMPDVDFTVNMPPLAARGSREIDVRGAATEAWVFESRHPGGLYRVTVIRFTDRSPDDALARVAQALALGEAASYVHASGFPGRTYEAGADHSVRAFVTAQRVYLLEVTGAAALGPDQTADFFNSFRIL